VRVDHRTTGTSVDRACVRVTVVRVSQLHLTVGGGARVSRGPVLRAGRLGSLLPRPLPDPVCSCGRLLRCLAASRWSILHLRVLLFGRSRGLVCGPSDDATVDFYSTTWRTGIGCGSGGVFLATVLVKRAAAQPGRGTSHCVRRKLWRACTCTSPRSSSLLTLSGRDGGCSGDWGSD